VGQPGEDTQENKDKTSTDEKVPKDEFKHVVIDVQNLLSVFICFEFGLRGFEAISIENDL
jgi:hypothetical protein